MRPFVLDPRTDVGVSGNMGWESGTYKATVNGAVVETGKFLLGLPQEEWEVALHPRYLECGCAGCAAASLAGFAGCEEVDRDCPRADTSGRHVEKAVCPGKSTYAKEEP